ncbi:hypothetical protein GOV05_04605, partial [Candidatus Woesearchaeota archaeon]|nr:hypothetical protein [Candidatus Woesearchaeota archaeon]
MKKKWAVSLVLALISLVLFLLYGKAMLVAFLFLVIEWFWPRIRDYILLINVGFLTYFWIDFLTFGTIILGYFYGPLFGVFVPLMMGLIQAIHDIDYTYTSYAQYLVVHMIIGFLAGFMGGVGFASAAIILLILRYLINYVISYFRGGIYYLGIPNDVFNLIIFSSIFTNYEKGLNKIFKN